MVFNGIEEKNCSVYGNKCGEIRRAYSLSTSCRSLHKIQAKWRFVCLSKWHRVQKIPFFFCVSIRMVTLIWRRSMISIRFCTLHENPSVGRRKGTFSNFNVITYVNVNMCGDVKQIIYDVVQHLESVCVATQTLAIQWMKTVMSSMFLGTMSNNNNVNGIPTTNSSRQLLTDWNSWADKRSKLSFAGNKKNKNKTTISINSFHAENWRALQTFHWFWHALFVIRNTF